MPALFKASMASGLRRPLGALPALWACTSRPACAARWLSMPSASTLRAELWVQRMRTWVVMVDFVSDASAAGAGRLHRNVERLAARRGGAAGRARGGRRGRLVEDGDVAQRVEVLPRDALRIGDPVLLAARV